jgi:hypothetical protein
MLSKQANQVTRAHSSVSYSISRVGSVLRAVYRYIILVVVFSVLTLAQHRIEKKVNCMLPAGRGVEERPRCVLCVSLARPCQLAQLPRIIKYRALRCSPSRSGLS